MPDGPAGQSCRIVIVLVADCRGRGRSGAKLEHVPEVLEPGHGLTRLVGELRRCGEEAGLAAVGVAPATPMEATRRILVERKAAGLSGDMQFTYRNPARSTEPGRILAGATALVVGAWPYGGADRATKPSGSRPKGRVARYASRDHYADLRTALGYLAQVLQEAGWRAHVVADDNGLVDRAAAERAGLGWFGKNSNILMPGQGSWFLLGSVVTDAPLPPDEPVADGCGSCRRCFSSCPTGASWLRACLTPASAWPGYYRPRVYSRSSTGLAWATASTAATIARMFALPTGCRPRCRQATTGEQLPRAVDKARSTCSRCSLKTACHCWPITAGGTYLNETPVTSAATRS